MISIQCWCGKEVALGRMHYPGGDPENGPAHLPTPQHPEEIPSEVCPNPECNSTEPEYDEFGRCEDCGECNPERADDGRDVTDEPSGLDDLRHQAEQARRLKR